MADKMQRLEQQCADLGYNITSFKYMLRAKRSEAKLASNRGKLRFEVYSRMAAKMFAAGLKGPFLWPEGVKEVVTALLGQSHSKPPADARQLTLEEWAQAMQ